MILDVILPEYGDFRHYSSGIQCFWIFFHQNRVLDVILSEYGDFTHYYSGMQCFYILYSTKISDFRRYSTNLVILDVIPQKSDFRRCSAKKMILDIILPEYGDFRHYSSKIL